MSFDALPHDHWPHIAAMLVGEWHITAAGADLRYHAAEHALKGTRLPAVRDLAARWGWKRTRVHDLIAGESWLDAARPWGWGDRRTRSGQVADTDRTSDGHAERSNAENQAKAGHSPDTDRTTAGHDPDSRANAIQDHPDHPTPSTHESPQPPGGDPAVAGEAHPPAGVPELEPPVQPPADRGLPAWVPDAAKCKPATRLEVLAMVVESLHAVRGLPVNPHRCGTDAKPLLALWRAVGRPPPGEFAGDVQLVAEWAQLSRDRLAARDIRAEGWAEGKDRSRSVSTLACQERWGDRLAAARAWQDRGRLEPRGPPGPAPPPRGRPSSGSLDDYNQALESWLQSSDPPYDHQAHNRESPERAPPELPGSLAAP